MSATALPAAASRSIRWTEEEETTLRTLVEELGVDDWNTLAARMTGRSEAACLQHWQVMHGTHPSQRTSTGDHAQAGARQHSRAHEARATINEKKSSKSKRSELTGASAVSKGLHRKPYVPGKRVRTAKRWTSEEEATLTSLVEELGVNAWNAIAAHMDDRSATGIQQHWLVMHGQHAACFKASRGSRLARRTSPQSARGDEDSEPEHVEDFEQWEELETTVVEATVVGASSNLSSETVVVEAVLMDERRAATTAR